MGDVIPFRRPKLTKKAEGLALCKSGHHRWVILQSQKFDVKQGRLVTVYRCERCGVTKSEAR